MKRGDRTGDFERWLDRELTGVIGAELRTAVPPPSPVGRTRSRRGRGIARLGVRAGALVAVVAALAVAGGGAAVATGSPNPVSWGQQVVQVVRVGPAPRTPVPSPEAPSSRPAAPSHGHPAPGVAADAQDAGSGRAKHQDDPEASPPPAQDQQSQDQQGQGQQSQGRAAKAHGLEKGQNQNP